MSSPTQRTRKRVVLPGRSNFLMAGIIPSDEHKSGITCSDCSHFAFTENMVAFLTTIAAILFRLYLQQIDEEPKSLPLIYTKIFFIFEGALIRWKTYKTGTPCIMKSIVVVFFVGFFFFMCVSYIFRCTHIRSGFMNGTMADEDGCSGFESLKDYANGSPQHEISQ